MLDRILRQMLRWMVFATLALFGAGAAYAGTPTLTFTEGWVGEYSSSINGPNNMYAFDGGTPDLNIKSVTIAQTSSTNQFELQGNDIPVTITVNFVNGTRVSAGGAVNWRETASGGVLRGIGLRIDQTLNDGYPLTSGKSKTYLLKIPNSTLVIANGGSASGNAALSSVLTSLNAQLGATPNFTMSKTAAASVNQGASLAYTIGIGNSGGGVSGTSVTVQDVLPAGMTYVSAAGVTGVSSVSCTQSGQTLTCTATLSSGIAAYSANGTASFRINTTAPSSGTSITNYASVDPNGTAFPPTASGCTSTMCANATTTLTGTGVISGHFTRNGGTAISGTTVNLLNSSDTVLASATTDSSGAYTFTGLVTGTYGVRFMSNGSIKGKAKTSHGSANGEYIRDITLNVGTSISDADAVQIDPAGVIYNSVTRQPVSGAVVTFLFNGSLVSNSWLDQTLGGANTQTTGADGRYSFVLNATAQSGTYTIAVSGPSGYTFQSQAIPASSGPYDPGLGGGIVAIQSQSTAPTGADATTYYLDFSLTVGTTSATTSNGVINNHIPIDPTPVVTIANTTNGAEPATNGTMTVTLSTASATNTVISYTVAGTATSGSDYTALSGSITIPAGQTSGTITIPVLDDALIEGGETVVVTLSGVTSGTATLSATPASLTATNTITDNDGNNAPVFSGTNALDSSNAPSYSFDYAENSASGTTVATVVATDADGNTLTYSIASGNGSGWYAINSSTGAITLTTAGAASLANNYEVTPNTQTLTVSVSDGTVSTTIEVKLNETNVNDNAPAFTSTNATDANSAPSYAFTYPENSASGATLGTVAASDADGNTLTFSITGGNTSGWYAIDSSTGVITLTAAGSTSLANDYEQTPNAQTLTVQVSDGTSSTTIQVALNETDVNENPPAITGPSGGSGAAASALTVNENQTAVTQMTADRPVTWSIVGGTEASKFSIAPNGIITFNTAPNYEAPTDGDTNNTYVLVVQAVDSSGAITTQTVTVTVANIDDTAPAITGPNGGAGAAASALTVNENQTAVTRLDANEGVTWSITGGTDAAKFSIAPDGTITFNTAPDYEAPTDSDGNNTYVLVVQAVDAAGNISTQTITVTVANVDDTAPVITGPSGGAGAAASTIGVYEDQTAVTRVTANETVTWSIVGGADAAQFTIAADGTITFRTAPDFENPADADHNNAYLVQVQARDAAGNVSTQTITVNVLNLDEITQKLNAISSALRSNLRNYAFGSLQDMLSFNEGLMQNTADGDCNANARNKGVHGSVRANQSGENVDLKLSRQVNACATRVRIYFDMGLAASSMAGNANLRALGSVRAETLVAKDVTVGLGLMGSFASDNLTSFANSSISDESLQGNLYVRARLSDTLRAGAFGSIGKAWYRFGLHDDGFNLAGRMTGDRYAYGAMLSGDMTLAGIKVTTDVALSRAVEKLGSASLAANYKGESRSGIGFAVGTVDATRLSVPAHLRLISRGDEKADSHSLVLTFSPGLLCEDKSADASGLSCGYQLGGKLSLATSSRDRAYLDARHEDVSGNTREVFSLGYAHRWGPVELGVSVDQDVSAMRGDSRAMMRLRFVGR